MMKKVYLAILVITMCLPLLGGLLGVKNQNAENRQLQQFPELSPTFTIEFEKYWQDQFPFRNEMITLYNQANQSLFKYSGNNQVVYGKDDMLFFSETLSEYQQNKPFTQHELIRLQNNFNLVNRLLSDKGISLYLMPVPNKNEIYSEKMPNQIRPVSTQNNYDELMKLDFDFEVINLKETFLSQDKQIYHNWDSHYNNLGAAITSDLITQTIANKSKNYQELPYIIEKSFSGDLTTMLYPSAQVLDDNMNYNLEQNYIYVRPLQSVDDLTIQTLNNNETDDLYMIRDSFGRALIPFISNAFNKVQYSRISPYYYQEAINLEYTNVLVEITQRNMFHWLKLSPVIESTPVELTETVSEGEPLMAQITIEPKHQMNFINIKPNDQSLAEKIEKAYLINDEQTLELFTIYNADNFEERDYDYGLSLYTTEEINLNNLEVIVLINGQYIQAQLSTQ